MYDIKKKRKENYLLNIFKVGRSFVAATTMPYTVMKRARKAT